MSSEKIKKPLRFLRDVLKVILLIVAFAGSLAIIAYSVHLIINNQPIKNPIPSSISKQVNFKLYYPTQLPKGYYVDQTSFTVENNSVIFSYRNKQDSIIYFTEKPVQGDLQLDGYINANLSNPRTLTNKYGIADIGTALSGAPDPIISYVAGGTWVIVNPSTSFSNTTVDGIAKSLTPA